MSRSKDTPLSAAERRALVEAPFPTVNVVRSAYNWNGYRKSLYIPERGRRVGRVTETDSGEDAFAMSYLHRSEA